MTNHISVYNNDDIFSKGKQLNHNMFASSQSSLFYSRYISIFAHCLVPTRQQATTQTDDEPIYQHAWMWSSLVWVYLSTPKLQRHRLHRLSLEMDIK